MKTKTGTLLMDNTLSVIIAAIGIALLIGAAFVIYNRLNYDVTSESAKTVLKNIANKIDALENNKETTFTIVGVNSDSLWYLVGWAKSSPEKPGKCILESCICVCPEITADICQSKGFCEKMSSDEIIVSDFTAESIVGIPVEGMPSSNVEYYEKVNPYVILPKKLVSLEVKKTKEKITFKHYSGEYLSKFKRANN